jgi:hypothetical protein
MKSNPKNVPSDAWVAGPTGELEDYPEWFLDWFEDNYPDVDILSPNRKTRDLMEREYSNWQRYNPARRKTSTIDPKGESYRPHGMGMDRKELREFLSTRPDVDIPKQMVRGNRKSMRFDTKLDQ